MANTVLTKSQQPTLDWANVSGALEYWAQVSTDPRFTTITQQRAGLATSQYALSSNLTDAKKYYWRFRTRTTTAYTTDQSVATTSGAGKNLRDVANNTGLAQSFKPDYSMPIARVTLQLKRAGGAPTNNVWVEIWTDNGSGLPSTQLYSDSATVLMSSIGTGAFAAATFDFAIPIPVVAGTTYHIVVQGDWAIDGVNYLLWEDTGSNSYADGSPTKENAALTWSADGTFDHLFTTQFQSWSQWSPVWSIWVDTTAEVAVTPTKWMLIDPDETTDKYELTVAPLLKVVPNMIPRTYDRNLAGDILQEFVAQRDVITLDFNDAYIHYTQVDEIMRFYNKRRAVYLIALTDNEQDVVERIWKVTFPSPPDFQQLGFGREDYHRGTVELEEAALT